MTSPDTEKPVYAQDEQLENVDLGKRDLTAETFVTNNAAYHSRLNELTFLQTLGRFKRAAFCCFIGTFGALSDNFQLSAPGQILALCGFVQTFGDPNPNGTCGGYTLAPSRVSAWGGIQTAGNFLTVLLCSFWAPHDRFGRKPVMYSVQLVMVAACLIEMFTTNWGVWAIAKFLNGVSVGLNQSVAPTYLSEVAPVNIRGAMLNLYSFWWGVGGFACAIGLQIVSTLPTSSWRHIIYSEWVFSGLAIICIFFVPETPRYYALRNNHDQAKKQLDNLYGGCEGYDIDKEYEIIRKEVDDGRILAAESKAMSWTAIWTGVNLRRTLISFSAFGWQLWLGVPVIFSYVSYFFSLAGLSQPFLATVALQTVYIVALILAIPAVEMFGRRPLLLYNGVIMIASLAGIAALAQKTSNGSSYGIGLAALTCLWMATYSISAGPIGYTYLAETSTVLLRAKTVSAALALCQAQNFFGSYATPYMLNAPNFGITGTAAFYGGMAAIGWVLVFFFVPETKGRSYVELDELFEKRVPARKFKSYETTVDQARKAAQTAGAA